MKVSSFIHLESDVMLVARFYVCGEVCLCTALVKDVSACS